MLRGSCPCCRGTTQRAAGGPCLCRLHIYVCARTRPCRCCAPPTDELLPRELDAALDRDIDEWKWARAAVWAALVPQIPPEQQPAVLQRGLDAALAVAYEPARADVLVALTPQLAGELLARALDAVFAIDDEGKRAHVLAA